MGHLGDLGRWHRGKMMMTRVVEIEAPGGAENMQIVMRDVGAPGRGEVRIAHRACGLNFIDVYQRSGL